MPVICRYYVAYLPFMGILLVIRGLLYYNSTQLALLSQAEGARDIVSKYSNLCISYSSVSLMHCCCSIGSIKAEPITSNFHPSCVITDYPQSHGWRAFNQMKRGRAQSQGNDVTVNAMIVSECYFVTYCSYAITSTKYAMLRICQFASCFTRIDLIHQKGRAE